MKEPSHFSTLILSLASTALVKMGLEPESKEEKNMELARYNIDLLDTLKEKTQNNLTEEESKMLSSCINDLRLQFIQVQNTQTQQKDKVSK